MKIANKKFKNKVKYFREQKNLTQKELAMKSGISERNIQSIEAGSDPRTSTSVKIAQILNTAVENLFSLSDSDENKKIS